MPKLHCFVLPGFWALQSWDHAAWIPRCLASSGQQAICETHLDYQVFVFIFLCDCSAMLFVCSSGDGHLRCFQFGYYDVAALSILKSLPEFSVARREISASRTRSPDLSRCWRESLCPFTDPAAGRGRSGWSTNSPTLLAFWWGCSDVPQWSQIPFFYDALCSGEAQKHRFSSGRWDSRNINWSF